MPKVTVEFESIEEAFYYLQTGHLAFSALQEFARWVREHDSVTNKPLWEKVVSTFWECTDGIEI